MKILKIVLAAGVLASTSAAHAAADWLLRIDGVKGSVKTSASVQRLEWSQAMAGGRFDAFEPTFLGGVYVASGDLDDGTWDLATLTARQATGGHEYLQITLKEVMVTSWQTSASDGSGIPMLSHPETVTLTWLAPGARTPIAGTWHAGGRFSGDIGVLKGFESVGFATRADGTLVFSTAMPAFTSAVPEPGSWGLMALGAGVVALRLRRRAWRA